MLSTGNNTRQRQCQEWKPPPVEHIKMNTNGARSLNLGLAWAAVVARDDVGRWLGGVERNIGKCMSSRLNFGQFMMPSF